MRRSLRSRAVVLLALTLVALGVGVAAPAVRAAGAGKAAVGKAAGGKAGRASTATTPTLTHAFPLSGPRLARARHASSAHRGGAAAPPRSTATHTSSTAARASSTATHTSTAAAHTSTAATHTSTAATHSASHTSTAAATTTAAVPPRAHRHAASRGPSLLKVLLLAAAFVIPALILVWLVRRDRRRSRAVDPKGLPRARRTVSPRTLSLLRPVFRYSASRRAYVLRILGNRAGPVLVEPEPEVTPTTWGRPPEPREESSAPRLDTILGSREVPGGARPARRDGAPGPTLVDPRGPESAPEDAPSHNGTSGPTRRR